MNKLILALALSVSVLVIAVEATARPGSAGGPGAAEFEGIGRLARHLDLSADQQAQISTLVNEAKLENAVDHERQRQIHEEMRGLTENFDAGAAQDFADEIGAIASRLAYSRVYVMSQVHAVLTDEQLSQMQEARESFGDRNMRMKHDQDSFLENDE
jgi:Spy/CpxP family protein refolding chaperone